MTTAATVTFNRDIAPIIFQNCAACHRPGEAGPFSLLTFDQVRQHANQIVQVTKTRYMPPWKPEPDSVDFEGARRLSDRQIALIQQWVKDGAVEGDTKDLPSAPAWTSGWQLGAPDLVITMSEPYPLTSEGQDNFRTFVLPIPVSSTRFVKGMEFRPGTKAIHHENTKIDRSGASRRQDDGDAVPGFDGSAGPNAQFPGGHFQGWTAGQVPRMLPEGMAWRLDPGSDLVIEMHMMPTGKPEAIKVSVGLFFTDVPPTRTPYILRLGRQTIDIPAGKKDYVSTDAYVLPVDVELLEIYPHAHFLAREIQGLARLPDGTTRLLLDIKDWDFRWQDNYRLSTPMRLPRGTTLEMRFTYDNSAENPRNPTRPPRRVTFGPNSSSEMGDLWIQVVPLGNGSREALDRDYLPKVLKEDIAGREKFLEVNPRAARVHTELASLYREAGRASDAIAHLEEAVRLEPGNALAQHDLGITLMGQKRLEEAAERLSLAARLKPDFSEAFSNLGVVRYLQGRLDDAITAYTQALQVRPESADTRYNLGKALASSGRVEDAIREYQKALEGKPNDADTQSSLGAALAIQGRLDEGISRYREALRINPNLTVALVDLAWLLAKTSEPGTQNAPEAVKLAEHAADLTRHQDATVLDALAAAYAAAGDLDRAVSTAQTALTLAHGAKDTRLADEIRKRLESYMKRAR